MKKEKQLNTSIPKSSVVMMVLAMLSLSHVADRTKSLYEGSFFKSTMVMEIKECIAQIERDFYHSLLSDDSQELKTFLQNIEKSNQTVEKNLAIIEGLAAGQEQELVEECYRLLNHAVSILESIKTNISAGHSEEAYRLIQEDHTSIEAARAGDAGRGFTVVAQEIGSLAQECANAAKNTAALIQSNIDVTQKGSMLAEETAGMPEQYQLRRPPV